MEKAIHITRLKDLGRFAKREFQRIYWGAEFCQNLIPNEKDTECAARFAGQNNLGFSMLTPFVTNRGLQALYRLFRLLRGLRFNNIEIVVNDWGVLECLHQEFRGVFEIALGRLLVRQNRDPTINSVLKEKQEPCFQKRSDGSLSIFIHVMPTKKYQAGIRASYVNSSLLYDFLSGFGVKRVELNNLIQGVDFKGIKFKKSLYSPFVNISTTRFCPMETTYQKKFRMNVCHKECQKHYDILRKKIFPEGIYKKGNTIFYKHPVKEFLLRENAVDRIVFQPKLLL